MFQTIPLLSEERQAELFSLHGEFKQKEVGTLKYLINNYVAAI
jgi:hypothetical protein